MAEWWGSGAVAVSPDVWTRGEFPSPAAYQIGLVRGVGMELDTVH